jgi:uncharacterized membrane protein YfcA
LLDLSVLELAALAAMVALAGFVDSIAGGGGLISLPAYLAAGLPPHMALATNKFSSCLGTLTAVLRFFKAGKVHVRIGAAATAGALAGSAAGTRLALAVSEETIHVVVLVLIPCVAAVFLFKDRLLPRPKDEPRQARHPELKALAVGLAVGCYDGFFGPGTGTFLGIAFFVMLRLDLVSASGSARLANLASNAGSLAVFLLHGKVLFPLALLTAAGGIAGNVLGAGLAVKKGERLIRPLMVAVLLLLLATIICQRLE